MIEHSEIGRNDAPEDVFVIPGPYPLSDFWLRFWLAWYRTRRAISRLLRTDKKREENK